MERYLSIQLKSFASLLQVLYLSLKLKTKLLYILLAFLLEFLKLIVVLEGSFFKISGFHSELSLKLMYFSSIKLL